MRLDGAILSNCAARAKTFALVAVIALGAFATLLIAAGKDPLKAYADTLFYVFGNAYGFSELLVRMIPLLLTAVAAALPARIGLINVGAEGQLYMGAWLATAGALAFRDQPAFVLLPVLTVFGFVGGGLWALIPGVLRALRRVNETISTLLDHGAARRARPTRNLRPLSKPRGCRLSFIRECISASSTPWPRSFSIRSP
jgi:simple sugar transport system permease protein